MACYERITESESAAEAPTCCLCDCRTRHRQVADDIWICAACDGEETEED